MEFLEYREVARLMCTVHNPDFQKNFQSLFLLLFLDLSLEQHTTLKEDNQHSLECKKIDEQPIVFTATSPNSFPNRVKNMWKHNLDSRSLVESLKTEVHYPLCWLRSENQQSYNTKQLKRSGWFYSPFVFGHSGLRKK